MVGWKHTVVGVVESFKGETQRVMERVPVGGGGRREGETREEEFGEIYGKEGGGFKNIKHLFLPLCYQDLGHNRCIFPPWNEAEVEDKEIQLSLGSDRKCMLRKKKIKKLEDQPMSPKAFQD